MKEVIVFTNGDSSKISTWSNVPYCFTEALLRKQVIVHRVDIRPHWRLDRMFNKYVMPCVRRVLPGTSYEYFRSVFHFLHVRYRIRKAVRKHSQADHHIFLTFSFNSQGLGHVRRIQFCDWTYDHHVKYFLSRRPDFLEARSIAREDESIRSADLVIPLFPQVESYMRLRYPRSRIQYIGNVINSVVEPRFDDAVLSRRKRSHRILFIGKPKYREGAVQLLEAFRMLKAEIPDLRLDIIGMRANHFDESIPPDVFLHGYLDKGVDVQRSLYYELMREAQVFVNTSPKWSAFSASVEAMHHYLPVVVTPYDEFVRTFSDEIAFGRYCNRNEPSAIVEELRKVLFSSDYASMCQEAHNAVRGFSWDAFMGNLMATLDGSGQAGGEGSVDTRLRYA